MAPVPQLSTPRARRWYRDSGSDDPTRFECRRGGSAPAFLVILIASLITAACSKEPEPSKAEPETVPTETERQPREDEIAEDCLGFVRATKIIPQGPAVDCPGCAREGSEL